ncbi:acyl-CoA thioesterase [Roseateles toxinivorans]|uniref:YbgC/YbaW family acyl-CoA thioester hydrolase n=1 Tax=Roseateles toxinivorans TaxID=270368 RepID=A0A4R6QCF6_9BURK|nr:acyl-CoA thioesterase [Roseateles toxinivorans]TDP60454.1 YbgC/YbaW family acyl-CoA thioester hydrolase [Roseateles toxinivorans]
MNPDSDNKVFRARVRYAECDAHGELSMASCMNYFSEAAAAALRSVDIDLRAMTAKGGPLRECAVTTQLHRALGYDDEIEVSVRLEDQKPQEFTLAFEMSLLREQRMVAEGRMRYVARPSPSGDARALADDLLARLPLLKHQTTSLG